MDNQGNIKAMARGSTPIFVQGWKDSKSHCISDKVIRNHGKLITKSSTAIQNDEDRVVKVSSKCAKKICCLYLKTINLMKVIHFFDP